jgi:hypothetical protein
MLLSAFFNRNKDQYTPREVRNKDETVPVITCWDDAKLFLLPVLPLTAQLEFSDRVISSLKIRYIALNLHIY